jgi:hypothetical protein
MKALLVGIACALAIPTASRQAGAASEEPKLRASLVCEKASGAGRVRCDAEARTEGATIVWGDVEILRSPAFASPLRGRIAPLDATVRGDDGWRWGFALVARDRGAGEVEARVRVVVCAAGVCRPRVVIVSAPLVVT